MATTNPIHADLEDVNTRVADMARVIPINIIFLNTFCSLKIKDMATGIKRTIRLPRIFGLPIMEKTLVVIPDSSLSTQ